MDQFRGVDQTLVEYKPCALCTPESAGSNEIRCTKFIIPRGAIIERNLFLSESSIMPKGKSSASANSTRDAGYTKKKTKKIKKKSSQKKTSNSRRKTTVATQPGVSRRRAPSNVYC